MVRVSRVLVASIAMTGVALAQDAAPPPPPGGAAPMAPMATPQAPAAAPNTIGADASFILPTGDYADGVDAAIGVAGRFEHKLNPNLSIIGRLGFIYNLTSQDGLSVNMITLTGGARYNLSATSADGVFLAGDVGLNNIRSSIDVGGVSGSDSETKVTAFLGGGYQLGKIQAKASVFITPDVGGGNGTDSSTLIGVVATVGYDFASF
jgi:hypothetical protein